METIPLSLKWQLGAVNSGLKAFWQNIKRGLISQAFMGHRPIDFYSESILVKYNEREDFTKLLKRDLISLRSKVDIKLEFGDNGEEIKKQYGVPYFKLNKTSSLNHKIYFYRLKIGEHKARCEMHFFNDTLFYKNYALNYLTPDDKYKIIDTLADKYLDEHFPHKTAKIVDSYGKVVLIDDSDLFHFTISYLDSASGFFVNLNACDNAEEKEEYVLDIKTQLQYRL